MNDACLYETFTRFPRNPGAASVSCAQVIARTKTCLVRRRVSPKLQRCYLSWISAYLHFQQVHFHRRRGQVSARGDLRNFLAYLGAGRALAAATQSEVVKAITFYYEHVLEESPGKLSIGAMTRRVELPSIVTAQEARQIINNLAGCSQLLVELLYCTGLRLSEALNLRVGDFDPAFSVVTVRAAGLNSEEHTATFKPGLGPTGRCLEVPETLRPALRHHREMVRRMHEADLRCGYGAARSSDCIAESDLSADSEVDPYSFAQQYFFAADTRVVDPRSGLEYRPHWYGGAVQQAVAVAARRAGVNKPVTCHTFRHSHACNLLAQGWDVRAVKERLGHHDIRTTAVYLQIALTAEEPWERTRKNDAAVADGAVGQQPVRHAPELSSLLRMISVVLVVLLPVLGRKLLKMD